jgi:hypothetical protein
MKKIDLSEFVFKINEDIRDFEESQATHSPDAKRTMEEWVNNFLIFSGYSEEEDFQVEDYEDDLYYGDSFEYQDLVNRRKYKSFRDDDRY